MTNEQLQAIGEAIASSPDGHVTATTARLLLDALKVQIEALGRYERGLRAIAAAACQDVGDSLSWTDYGEWVQAQVENLIDHGADAECWSCGTAVHEGACVSEDGDNATAMCRVCGCTDLDCRQCVERTGAACHWVEADLCSACVDAEKAKG